MRFPADKRAHIVIAKRVFSRLNTAHISATQGKGMAEDDGRNLALPHPKLTDVFRYISEVRRSLSAWPP